MTADAMPLWRAGRKLAAIALLRKAPSATPELQPRLAAATTALARDLTRAGEIVDGLEALHLLDPQDRAAASGVAIEIAIAAMVSDRRWFALQARALVGDPAAAAALAALADPSDDLRPMKLITATRDPRLDVALRRVVATCAATAFARRGNHARAATMLPEAESRDERLLAALLRWAAAGGATPIDPAACDWHHASRVCRDAPALLARLIGRPAAGDLQATAAFWIARARRDAAEPLLAAAQREQLDDWRLARNLATIGYCRGLEAAPGVDVEAWRICIAQTAALVENPRWLESFVVSRLEVYGVEPDLARCCEDAREDIVKLVDDELARLATGAQGRGDTSATQLAERLRAELVRERRAAAALWSAGDARTATDHRLAFGPLFAERTGCPLPRIDDPTIRRWFSELGVGAAFSALGDVEAARAATLDVILRWSPPDTPGPEEFIRCNPGYAPLSGRDSRLRRDAGSLLVDIELDALRRELSARTPGCEAVARRIALAIREASAFGEGAEARSAIRRAILTRCNQLVATKETASIDASIALLQTAGSAGIDDLDAALAESHRAGARVLMAGGCHFDAVAPLEAAWELDRTTAWVPQQLVALLLLQVDALRDDGCHAEAVETIERAREIAAAAGAEYPAAPEVASLGRGVAMVSGGARASSLYRNRNAAEAPPEETPEQARREIAAGSQARQRGDHDAAAAHAERALALAPTNADVVAAVVRSQLEIARALAAEPGAVLYERARATLAAALRRVPADADLRDASTLVARDAVLYSVDSDRVTVLHRKAMRCALRGAWSDAGIVLRTIVAIAPRPEPLVLALYAEALIQEASSRRDDDSSDLWRAARGAVAAGQVLAPRDARWRQLRGQIEQASAGEE